MKKWFLHSLRQAGRDKGHLGAIWSAAIYHRFGLPRSGFCFFVWFLRQPSCKWYLDHIVAYQLRQIGGVLESPKPYLTPLDSKDFHRYAYLITKLTKSCSDKILEHLGLITRAERSEDYCLRMPDTA